MPKENYQPSLTAAKGQSPRDLATGKKGELLPIFETLKSIAVLELAVLRLCHVEPRFGHLFERHGLPSLRTSPSGLEGLLMIITEQFLSLNAAAAIWARVRARLGSCLAEEVLACSETELLRLGLSKAKVNAFYAAAMADLSFEGLDETGVSQKLCAIKGVGPWTADIYLLSVLQAADAWPKGDLALRVAVQDFLNLPQRPEISEMDALAENWRPLRAVAARLLWSHYRSLKGIPQLSP